MSGKLLWTGATFILASGLVSQLGVPSVDAIGALLMVIGVVLLWFNK